MLSLLSHINYLLFHAVNVHAGQSTLLDKLMVFCANDLIFFWPVLLLLAWGIPFSWRKRAVSDSEAASLGKRRSAVLWVAVACVLAYALNLTIEQFVHEPRPFVTHHVHLLVQHVADASFPSDHTAWSFAVVGMLLLSLFPWFTVSRAKGTETDRQTLLTSQTPRRKTILFLGLVLAAIVIASIIGIARIFVGVHYPGDIVGGAIDGLIAALIASALYRWLRRPTAAVIQFARRCYLA